MNIRVLGQVGKQALRLDPTMIIKKGCKGLGNIKVAGEMGVGKII